MKIVLSFSRIWSWSQCSVRQLLSVFTNESWLLYRHRRDQRWFSREISAHLAHQKTTMMRLKVSDNIEDPRLREAKRQVMKTSSTTQVYDWFRINMFYIVLDRIVPELEVIWSNISLFMDSAPWCVAKDV